MAEMEKEEPGDMPMVDMKRPKRKMGTEMAMPMMDSPYPYGLQIRLENDELDKLKFKLPRVGEEFCLEAMVRVTNVSESQSAGNKGDRAVSLQITKMVLEPPESGDST